MSTIDLWLVEGASVGTLAFTVVPTLMLPDGVITGFSVFEVSPSVMVTSGCTVAALVATTRGPLVPPLVAGNMVWGCLDIVLGVVASFTVVGSVPMRLVGGATVIPTGETGALVATGSAVGGPPTVRMVATAAGCAGIAVCVDMSFLPASVVGAMVSRRGVGLLLFSLAEIGVVIVVATLCAAVTDVPGLSGLFDTDVALSVPLTKQTA